MTAAVDSIVDRWTKQYRASEAAQVSSATSRWSG